MSKLIKVLLLTLENERNLGDRVIADCSKYMVDKILKESHSKYILDSEDFKMVNVKQIKESDILIFVGGGLISKNYTGLIRRMDEITKLAEELDKIVIFNAVGVEGYGVEKEYQILKKIINRNCVKFISTRDDIELLDNRYINDKSSIKSTRIADSGIWAEEVYNISRDETSDIIGLGIIRSHIFKDNDINFNEEKQLKMWSNIIGELEGKKEKWMMFTNGLKRDQDFAEKILEYMGRKEEIDSKIIKRPTDAKELIKNISNFKGIIAARLHANIIAYSLGIPTIGIVWNPKIVWFGKIIGTPNRFFQVEDINVKEVVVEMSKSIEEGYDYKFFKKYKELSYELLKEQMDIYLNNQQI